MSSSVQKLREANLAIIPTAGDGACGYWAFGASNGPLEPGDVMRSPKGRDDERAELLMVWLHDARSRAVKYIDENRRVFNNDRSLFVAQEFTTSSRKEGQRVQEKTYVHIFQPENNEKHLDMWEWAGCSQMRALAGVYGVDIAVIQPDSNGPAVQVYLHDSAQDVQRMQWTEVLARLKGEVRGAAKMIAVHFNGVNHWSALLPPSAATGPTPNDWPSSAPSKVQLARPDPPLSSPCLVSSVLVHCSGQGGAHSQGANGHHGGRKGAVQGTRVRRS